MVLGGTFLKEEIAKMLQIFSTPLQPYVRLDMLNGSPLREGKITMCTVPLQIPPSMPNTKAMEGYVSDELELGYHHTSTSPARAGFFFVKKRCLMPCTDYQGLNSLVGTIS